MANKKLEPLSKLERLLDLTALLMQTARPLSLDEIVSSLPERAYPAQGGEAVRRTFERDKDELRSLGIPLETVYAPGGESGSHRYRIDQQVFGSDPPALDAHESASLVTALASVRFDQDKPNVPVWMLGGAASGEQGKPEIPVAELPGGENVRRLMEAVTGSIVVTFSYREEKRHVEPHRMVFAKGHWQLKGFDRLRESDRQFRTDRIAGLVELTEESFVSPAGIADVEIDHPWRFGDGKGVSARLLIDERHAAWGKGFLGESGVVEERDDGSVVVTEIVRNEAAFRSFVLTFLEGAEILEPEEFRTNMASWLGELAE